MIEVQPPECEFWNFQLDNYWMESLDYRYAPVWVNSHTAKYNADGSATITIARENRGFSNWMDTDGHSTRQHAAALDTRRSPGAAVPRSEARQGCSCLAWPRRCCVPMRRALRGLRTFLSRRAT